MAVAVAAMVGAAGLVMVDWAEEVVAGKMEGVEAGETAALEAALRGEQSREISATIYS
jgi:hypothetical protein